MKKSLQLVAAVLAVLVALVAFFLWRYRSIEREIRDIPAPERRAFYERTLETLTSVCARPAGPELQSYCREQARLIVRFPECDSTCRDIAHRFVANPNR